MISNSPVSYWQDYKNRNHTILFTASWTIGLDIHASSPQRWLYPVNLLYQKGISWTWFQIAQRLIRKTTRIKIKLWLFTASSTTGLDIHASNPQRWLYPVYPTRNFMNMISNSPVSYSPDYKNQTTLCYICLFLVQCLIVWTSNIWTHFMI